MGQGAGLRGGHALHASTRTHSLPAHPLAARTPTRCPQLLELDEVEESGGQTAKYSALERWATQLGSLHSAVVAKLAA